MKDVIRRFDSWGSIYDKRDIYICYLAELMHDECYLRVNNIKKVIGVFNGDNFVDFETCDVFEVLAFSDAKTKNVGKYVVWPRKAYFEEGIIRLNDVLSDFYDGNLSKLDNTNIKNNVRSRRFFLKK